MRFLQRSDTGEYSLTRAFASDEEVQPYAILSHTWLEDAQEPTFEDLMNGTGGEKLGYEKIRFCAEQANRDGLQYFWVDTCCINKSNSAELSQAVNSMFRWYRNATRCYVYLADVTSGRIGDHFHSQWDSDLGRSRWFTRGWTLQELLAPPSIEFFSYERIRIGDRSSLQHQIQQITDVPASALQGARLSQFSVDERFLWIERRQTKLPEDKVYSLLGILDVDIPLYYGEGAINASKRVRELIDKRERCLQDLRLTDPRDDKKRIEDTKGGLLQDSYGWILGNSDFQRWQNESQSRLLWIKGDPGKGKTMLLCGIINELSMAIDKTALLSYFFCQATDSRINSATAILRGLLFMLGSQQPSLISHLQKKHNYAGKALFEDANAWSALSEIFANIVQDPSLESGYVIIDALDECVTGLPELLDFIAQTSSMSSRVKWILSSRNWSNIEERLEITGDRVRLSLELNAESVSAAVHSYINRKGSWLAQKKKYSDQTKHAVLEYLHTNANNTFLWVALVCQNLDKMSRFNIATKLKEFPPGLGSLYERMIQRIIYSDDADLCKRVLAIVAVVYRPITLHELSSLVEELDSIAEDFDEVREIISLCGSLLTIRNSSVYFVHQSARDFLLKEAVQAVFPSGREIVHYTIFSRSLQAMSHTLRRDIYGLDGLGHSIEQVQQPEPDPLAASRYSCIYWIDHLCEYNASSSVCGRDDLQGGGTVDNFLREKYLYWLEALSLCRSMSKGVVSIAKLEILLQRGESPFELKELIRDARRFIMSHKLAIENSPLQAYASAMLFSPTRSLIRNLFKKEEPNWMILKPDMQEKWSNCLLTLEGHSKPVRSVVFSHDSTRLASASKDGSTVKIWDTGSGECLQTLEGCGRGSFAQEVAFSHDLTRLASGLLASGSDSGIIKVRDIGSGECIQTLRGYGSVLAFSHDSARLASASGKEVKLWDIRNGNCLITLENFSGTIYSIAFSHDSIRLAAASRDGIIQVWDAGSGECLLTLGKYYADGHYGRSQDKDPFYSVAFSHDSSQLAAASYDGTIGVWDSISGESLLTLHGHRSKVTSVAFSYNSTQLVSAAADSTIMVWDASSGRCLSIFEGHSSAVCSAVFSHNSTLLASASEDGTIKVWEASGSERLSSQQGHSGDVSSIAFSHDSTRIASASYDGTVKVWDAGSSNCLLTIKDHSATTPPAVYTVAFSPGSSWLVSTGFYNETKIWDAVSGECLSTHWESFKAIETLAEIKTISTKVALSHDFIQLASASGSTVNIWDTSSDERLLTLEIPSCYINMVAFSHDSTRLATLLGRGEANNWDTSSDEIKIWDTSSGECLLRLAESEDDSSSIKMVAFSQNSTRLASALADGTVKIWDTSNGDCLSTLKGHSFPVREVAFSNNSTQLASVSLDGVVMIWDAHSGECLSTINLKRHLQSISFDSSDKYLHTDIGVISLSTGVTATPPHVMIDQQIPQYQGPSLSEDGVWIRYNSENILWLPAEYRPRCLAVSGGVVAIGVKGGKVWTCEVQAGVS